MRASLCLRPGSAAPTNAQPNFARDGKAAISRPASRTALGAALLLERIARDTYAERGGGAVSPTQWAALRYLHRTPEEAHTPLHLARYLGVTPGPASRTVASLERRGFVTRRRNPFDGRSVLIELTELGQRLLEEDPIERLAIALDGLDADQRRVLEASLESIAGLLSAPVKEDADGRDTGD